MSAESLRVLLDQGRRRLWLQRLLQLLLRAASVSTLSTLLLLGVHVLWRAVPTAALITVLAVPIAVALLVAAARRPALAFVARWLDAELDAQSLFATSLEFCCMEFSSTDSAAPRAAPATKTAFATWSQATLLRSRARWQALPALNLRPLASLVLLIAVLAGATLALPGKIATASAAERTGTLPSQALAPDSLADDLPLITQLRSSANRGTNDSATAPQANTASTAPSSTAVTQNTSEANDAEIAASETARATAAASNNGSAADNAATNHADAPSQPARESDAAALQARLRAIAATRTPTPADAASAATGDALALGAAHSGDDAAAFDRTQAQLARSANNVSATRYGASAAGPNISASNRNSDAVTPAPGSGPAEAALIQRFIQLRDSQLRDNEP